MKYEQIVKGRFLRRPNRFIAYVEIDGKEEKVHVKNTGRCKELLVPGATVYLEKGSNPERKTAYDLVKVVKGNRLINMDSQAPNKVVGEWLAAGGLFPDITCLRPETTYGKSRFDFYVETEKEKIFLEVKGCTLEEDGVCRFPDAPSERAVKHVEELIQAHKEGYGAYIVFVIQMSDVSYFTPNRETHPEFADALIRAHEAGVKILAYSCSVTETELEIKDPVPVRLRLQGQLEDIPAPLLTWYQESRRILPWREDPTPYHVWVSEIMLQQTRVEAVKPYFKRFMEQLPDVKALAQATEETLLKLWEGLGYYNRVRNLQAAARQIMELYDGEMPGSVEELLKLKGIGSYTAGAIASIAFGQKAVAVDGNVLRVLSRIRMDAREITDAKVKAAVEQELLQVVPEDQPGNFNQAMMELGAMVCVPNGRPLCETCPLQQICKASTQGCQEEYPIKAVKKERTVEEKTVMILLDENRTALHKRPAKGLLAGMYEFPMAEGYLTEQQVQQYLKERGIRSVWIRRLQDSKHIFTHKEWHMQGYLVRVDELEPQGENDWIYVEPVQTREAYPIPSAFAAYVPYLNIRIGKEVLDHSAELN